MRFLNHIINAFSVPQPQPVAISAPPNWFGELEGSPKKRRSGPVLVNEATNTFEFPDNDMYAGIEIAQHLTENDIVGLRKKQYNPQNPAYAEAKRYFSKNPSCSKHDLSENSAPPWASFQKIAPDTAKDVLAIFRAGIMRK